MAALIAVAVLISTGGGALLRSLGQGLQEMSDQISQDIGQPQRTVPTVIGLKHDEAIAELMSAGFTKFELDLLGDPSCRVVRTEPAAEHTIPHDQKVVVYREPSGNDPSRCQ